MGQFDGKVAIVTGGTMGIGAAIAEVFVEEGAKVVIASRNAAQGEALAERLGAAVRYRRTDVAQRDQVQTLVDFALAEFGGLDAMVNNAAITGAFHNRFLDDDMADFDAVVRVNLAGVMYGSQIAARHMAGQGGGAIVNLSSIAAEVPGFALLAYRAAKAGVENFTRSLAIDLGEYGVRVNAIQPGHIPTRNSDFGGHPGLTPEQSAELNAIVDTIYNADQPLKRRGDPRDVAYAAAFLASDRAAYITGQVIAVDGGVTAGSAFNQNKLLGDARRDYLAKFGLE
ncbi:SDR family NAD(P)-dependent oxidoreductase [Novosphingobium sp. JCM 18896]|uniref:SDR family NAD(P)-dependent oxidoreductase n=1 Tax=Novosphingobium sp. JCM 18896 TaxID=2989731 RepID=UPI002221476C|nr:SDR family NAD(P)-dependent oxidoreductase [Novosphingobium sp. JCM 18896]MCW1427625.1 SDR family oxidoreductase [Novosphingobium sp. JCM 18896]